MRKSAKGSVKSVKLPSKLSLDIIKIVLVSCIMQIKDKIITYNRSAHTQKQNNNYTKNVKTMRNL